MQNLQVIEVKGVRVLTTQQIAEAYGANVQLIKNNYNYNKQRYLEGKHYISIQGEELRQFKARFEIQTNLKYAHILYLWTEKGALLHAKSLNTDKAWEVYDYLVDFYFRAKEKVTETKPVPVKPVPTSNMRTVIDVPENPQMLTAIQKIMDDLTCMRVLLQDCIKYTSEETYKEKRKVAEEVVHIIVSDFLTLQGLKPKLIQKKY